MVQVCVFQPRCGAFLCASQPRSDFYFNLYSFTVDALLPQRSPSVSPWVVASDVQASVTGRSGSPFYAYAEEHLESCLNRRQLVFAVPQSVASSHCSELRSLDLSVTIMVVHWCRFVSPSFLSLSSISSTLFSNFNLPWCSCPLSLSTTGGLLLKACSARLQLV